MFESNLAPKAFEPKEEIIGVIKIVGIFSFVFTIFFAIPIMLLFYSFSEEESASRSKHASKGLEEQVLVEKEKEKGEVSEKPINEAIKVNYEYDNGSDIASQPIELAQEANKSIANLGNSTKDVKLFDVLEIVDGDTIKVNELGTIRLIGIDTPEIKDPRKVVQCFGKESLNRANELLAGKKVWLEFDPANRIDKYGRTLAYVYREDGYFYNKEMIREGYAHSYTKYPHPKMEEFNLAQQEARNAKRGLWAENTCNGNTEQPAKEANTISSSLSPSPTPTPSPTPKPVVSSDSPRSCPANCKEAKMRGMAPIYQGQECYSVKLDRDRDGIACEK